LALYGKGSSGYENIENKTYHYAEILLGDKKNYKYWSILHHENNNLDFAFFTKPDASDWKSIMVLKENGNVGIGTTDPGAKLEVNGDIRASGTIRGGGDYAAYENRNGGIKTWTLTTPDWGFYYGPEYGSWLNIHGDLAIMPTSGEAPSPDAKPATGRLYVAGNVGIGTKSPSERLEVAGTVKAAAFDLNGDVITSWPAGGGAGDGHSLDAADGDPVDAVYVDNDGNVGIGTTIPGSKLDVAGELYVTSAGESIFRYNTAGDIYLFIEPKYISDTDSYVRIGAYDNNGDMGYRNIVIPSGNVGIGITKPARKLHVNDVMRLQPRSSAPSSPSMGDMYMDSNDGKLKVYDGSTWRACW
jgi:hypothetical protein